MREFFDIGTRIILGFYTVFVKRNLDYAQWGDGSPVPKFNF